MYCIRSAAQEKDNKARSRCHWFKSRHTVKYRTNYAKKVSRPFQLYNFVGDQKFAQWQDALTSCGTENFSVVDPDPELKFRIRIQQKVKEHKNKTVNSGLFVLLDSSIE